MTEPREKTAAELWGEAADAWDKTARAYEKAERRFRFALAFYVVGVLVYPLVLTCAEALGWIG